MSDLTSEEVLEVLENDFDPAFIALMRRRLVYGAGNWGLVSQYLTVPWRGNDRRPATVKSYRDDVDRLLDDFEKSGEVHKLADAVNYLMFLFMRVTRYPETIVRE